MSLLRVRLVSPARVVYEGEASSVVAPAWDGQLGVLPGHAPMITLLGAGVLSIDLPGGGSSETYVAGGALQVVADQVTILSDYAGTAPPEVLPDLVRPEDVEDHELESSKGNPLV